MLSRLKLTKRALRGGIMANNRSTCTSQVPLWRNTSAIMKHWMAPFENGQILDEFLLLSQKQSEQKFNHFSWPSNMVRFFRAMECSQSLRRRSSAIVLRISISFLSWASMWTWVTHKPLVSSVMLLIWTWAAGSTKGGSIKNCNCKNCDFLPVKFKVGTL